MAGELDCFRNEAILRIASLSAGADEVTIVAWFPGRGVSDLIEAMNSSREIFSFVITPILLSLTESSKNNIIKV